MYNTVSVRSQDVVVPGVMTLTVLAPEMAAASAPGQFYMLKSWREQDPFLMRPISIDHIDVQAGTLTFLYKVVGRGTELLSHLRGGDTLELLQALQPKGVVHCFSGSKEMAKEIIKLGMYIGLNGVATFKNARKALEVVETIPLERLVLETDCPYLAPEPCRGQRNNSALIPHIAARIGQVLGLSPQAVLRQTAENARALYGLQV